MGVINKTTEKINDLLDKVEDLPSEGLVGKTPVFDIGVVTTVSAGSPADVDIRTNGVDENGNPIYLLDFDIPKGKDGTSTGEGGEILSVDWTDVLNKPDWVDSTTKPSYTASEVGALPADTAFKTINGKSILGVGDIQIQGGSSGGSGVGSTYPGYKNAEIFNDYDNNIAAGAHAHAEGRETNATGPRAHAEGYLTKVFAADAHAEGRETWCLGSQGHVEGMYGIAYASLSHVEGTAFLPGSPVSSSVTILDNEGAIRSLLSNENFFFWSPKEDGTKFMKMRYNSLKKFYAMQACFGERSHVEGANNLCAATTSHVEGYENVCGDTFPMHGSPIVFDCLHIEGMYNKILNWEGTSCAHLGGRFSTINSGICTFGHGTNLSLSNDFEVAFGKYNSSNENGKKVLFAYGIGTSDSDRKNAISIFEDGSVAIPQFTSDRIETALANSEKLGTQVTEIQSSLLAEINSLKEEVQALYDYIINNPGGGGEQTGKAYVIGITLIFKESETINVSNDTLNITDSEIRVENETLII